MNYNYIYRGSALCGYIVQVDVLRPIWFGRYDVFCLLRKWLLIVLWHPTHRALFSMMEKDDLFCSTRASTDKLSIIWDSWYLRCHCSSVSSRWSSSMRYLVCLLHRLNKDLTQFKVKLRLPFYNPHETGHCGLSPAGWGPCQDTTGLKTPEHHLPSVSRPSRPSSVYFISVSIYLECIL